MKSLLPPVFIFSCAVTLAGGSSCTFKEATLAPTAASQPAPAAIPAASVAPAPGRPVTLQIGDWDDPTELKRDLSRLESGVLSNEEPIVLPIGFSGPIRIVVPKSAQDSDQDYEELQASGHWSTDLEGHYTSPAQISQTSDDTGWLLQTELPQNWVAQNVDSKYFLQLTFVNGQRVVIERVSVLIAAPPIQVAFQQLSVADIGALNPSFMELSSLQFDGYLVQGLKVTNNSWYPITVQTPVQLTGAISTHFYKIEVNQQACAYTLARTDWDDVLASQLYLLPIEDGLPDSLEQTINQGLAQHGIQRQLAPGTTKLYGVYASGTGIKSLKGGGYPRPDLSPTQVVTGCRSRCVVTEQQDDNYWKFQNWPGASSDCFHNWCGANNIPPVSNEAACNACMDWENAMALPWNDGHRRCVGNLVGNFGGYPSPVPWERTFQYGMADTGSQKSPILLNLDAQNVIQAAYPLSSGLEAPTFRPFARQFSDQVELGE